MKKLLVLFFVSMVLMIRLHAQLPGTVKALGVKMNEQVSKGFKGYSIGDKVPDIVLPKLMNYKNRKAKLSDFKGDLLIIDFWSIGCSSCTDGLKKIKLLQAQFKDSLHVIVATVNKESIVEKLFFREKYYEPIIDGLNIPFVVEDTLLARYFPYSSIPHLVWLDKNMVVRAITRSEFVNADNISRFLRREELKLPVKKDALAFAPELPLMGFTNNTVLKIPQTLGYSAITKRINGTGAYSAMVTDSVAGLIRFYEINSYIIQFYGLYCGGIYDANPYYVFFNTNPSRKREGLRLNVKDSSRFFYPLNSGLSISEWRDANTYCYEAVYPIGTSKEEIISRMRDDLDKWFHLESHVELTAENKKVLVLTDR